MIKTQRGPEGVRKISVMQPCQLSFNFLLCFDNSNQNNLISYNFCYILRKSLNEYYVFAPNTLVSISWQNKDKIVGHIQFPDMSIFYLWCRVSKFSLAYLFIFKIYLLNCSLLMNTKYPITILDLVITFNYCSCTKMSSSEFSTENVVNIHILRASCGG